MEGHGLKGLCHQEGVTMQGLKSAEIRRMFIEFYAKKHAHAFVASSPAVPVDDPTLLFTNAG